MKINHPLRLAFLSVFILICAVMIALRVFGIINSQQHDLAETKIKEAKAIRGNIYTYDHQLLAATSAKYDVYFDGTVLSLTDNQINTLAQDLSDIFDSKFIEFKNKLENAKTKQYYPLKKNATVSQIEFLEKNKFYRKPLNGGFIIKESVFRHRPNGDTILAARTIGGFSKINHSPAYGLEYRYNSKLSGKDGLQTILFESNIERQLHSPRNIDSDPGQHLITTLEIDYQDILEQALKTRLKKHNANFGVSILMEVNTGRVKAISNLKKNKRGQYVESKNYGVAEGVEPGSTFKLASVMAYLEDHVDAELDDTIHCKNGKFRFRGAPRPTVDSKKLGIVSLKEAFAYSSNIGVGRLIQKHYGESQEKFINRIYSFGLAQRSEIDLDGIPKPKIKFPTDASWSGISLPWISIGYEIQLTALDILTFYNAIANNGYLVYPYLGHAFRDGSNFIEIERDNISHSICSESTVKKAHILLREVVLNGTGSKLKKLPFPVSGKTGTTVKNYSNNKGKKEYQSSFVGFFPSNNPKYTCIVLIDSPQKKYYGSEVAVPVFKEIAEKIYAKEGMNWESLNQPVVSINNLQDSLQDYYNRIKNKEVRSGYYPSVVNMHITDAVRFLQSNGYTVMIDGSVGVVKKQYPKANSPVSRDLAITLTL